MFEFELFFPDYPEFGENGVVPLTEVVKSDAMTISMLQDKERIGRDVTFGSEEVDLEFYSGEYDLSNLNIQTPDGRITQGFTMGYEFIAEGLKREGSELQAQLRISIDGQVFSIGDLDLKNANHNGYDCIKCKVIQESNRALIARNLDTEIDLLSNIGLFEQEITTPTLYNILLKAKPEFGTSRWEMKERKVHFAGGSQYANYSTVSKLYGLRKSLVPFYQTSGLGNLSFAYNNFVIIEAQNDIFNLTVTRDIDVDFIYRSSGPSGQARISLFWAVFEDPFTSLLEAESYGEPFTYQITGGVPQEYHLPSEITFTIPYIGRGQSLSVFWAFDWEIENLTATSGMADWVSTVGNILSATTGIPPFQLISEVSGQSESDVNQGPTFWDFKKDNTIITGTEVGVDSVIKGMRWIDTFKQKAKSINGLQVESSCLGAGGEFYDVMITDGNRIRQRLDVPFTMKWKDNATQLNMIRADYQVNKNKIIIEQEPDFYRNVEIGAYLSDPDIDYSETFAEKNTVLRFEPQFANYEQDDDQDNTIDAICTAAQYHSGNRNAINAKVFSLPICFDAFSIKSAQEQNTQTTKETSTSADDRKFGIDCVLLPPAYVYSFGKRLLVRKVSSQPGMMEVLNNDQDGDGLPINWTLLGIGGSLTITGGSNAGNYNVVNIEPQVIALQRIPAAEIIEENKIITISYTIVGVQYMSRTNEGFDILSGLNSADNYANLRFGIREIAKHWNKRLSTYAMWSKTGKFKKMYYKNNPALISQFNGGEVLHYSEDISLTTPTVTPRQITRKVSMDVAEGMRLHEAISEQRGFVRMADPNGKVHRVFLDSSSLQVSENINILSGEQAYEPETLTISKSGETITINGTGYNADFVGEIDFDATGNFVRIFDTNSIPLTNLYRYDKVIVDGISFANMTDLATALNGL